MQRSSSFSRRRNDNKILTLKFPFINIVNTQPTLSCQSCHSGPSQATNESTMHLVDISGFRDEVVRSIGLGTRPKSENQYRRKSIKRLATFMIRDYMN